MKYCTFCGGQIDDEAVLCPHCGRMLQSVQAVPQSKPQLNILCLLGFIFSFIFCIVGLILSIVGYNQVKNTDDVTGKNLAKAGIIISAVALGIVALIVIVYLNLFIIFLGVFAGSVSVF